MVLVFWATSGSALGLFQVVVEGIMRGCGSRPHPTPQSTPFLCAIRNSFSFVQFIELSSQLVVNILYPPKRTLAYFLLMCLQASSFQPCSVTDTVSRLACSGQFLEIVPERERGVGDCRLPPSETCSVLTNHVVASVRTTLLSFSSCQIILHCIGIPPFVISFLNG